MVAGDHQLSGREESQTMEWNFADSIKYPAWCGDIRHHEWWFLTT
jgi:hypothetical protein